MMTVTISDELAARLHALRDRDDDFNQVVEAALAETARRWEREAAGRAEMQAMLDGPRHLFDPEATYRRYQEKYGLPDLSHLTGEALVEDTERLIAAMPPERRAAMEREGLL